MKCPHCNKEISNPNMRFCNFCGGKLAVTTATSQPEKQAQQEISKASTITPDTSVKTQYDEPEFDISETAQRIKNSVKHSVNNIKDAYDTGSRYTVPDSILNASLAPCEGERSVKQYRFLRMTLPIIGYKADASLQVTNKRLLYHAIGSTVFGGKEESYSEVSIDDVAGISIERSTSLNIPVLLVLLLINLALTGVGLLFGLLGSAVSASGHDLAFIPAIFSAACLVAVFALMKKKHYGFAHLIDCLGNTIALSGLAASYFGNLISNLSSLMGYSSGGGVTLLHLVLAIVAVCSGLLYWITLFLAMFKKNISIVVTSKTGSTTAIDCSPNKSWLFGVSNLTPLVYMFETKDFPIMENELGAMISDIQKMGDYGIEKWSK